MLDLTVKDPEYYYRKFKDAVVDAPSFYRKYKYCDLSICQGQCCTAGVGIYPEERKNIERLVKENSEFFATIGLGKDSMLFYDLEDSEMGAYTEIKDFQYSVPIPEHFTSTTCVFRDSIGRCSLQLLGANQGKDSWTYKPFYCWMFPIDIIERDGKQVIVVTSQETDDRTGAVREGYPGFAEYTKCGAQMPDGKPAYQIFEREINALSKLLKRDLLAEIAENTPSLRA